MPIRRSCSGKLYYNVCIRLNISISLVKIFSFVCANIYNENHVVLCFDISFFQSNLPLCAAVEEDIYICTNLQFIRKRAKNILLGKTKVGICELYSLALTTINLKTDLYEGERLERERGISVLKVSV